MKRRHSSLLVWIYAVALIVMGTSVLAMMGLWPGVERMQVSGLTNGQAVGLTLALMALIGVRLFLLLRARRLVADPPDAPQGPPSQSSD